VFSVPCAASPPVSADGSSIAFSSSLSDWKNDEIFEPKDMASDKYRTHIGSLLGFQASGKDWTRDAERQISVELLKKLGARNKGMDTTRSHRSPK